MTYSVLDAPALAHDLVRLPHGVQVAQVVRTALACDPGDLATLSARHPGPHRLHRWGTVLASGPPAPRPPEPPTAGESSTSTAVTHRPHRAPVGDLAAVDRMLRHDVLDWTWLGSGDLRVQDPEGSRACDVLADAAASAYCGERLDESTRRSMAAPYLAAALARPRQTGHDVVDAALRHVAGTGDAGRARWRRVVDELGPGTTGWAPSLDEATWALALAGRSRLAADAQLAAADAFVAAGFTPHDADLGLFAAVSGAVHALLCVDLLPSVHADLLLGPWRRVHDRGTGARRPG